MRRRLILMLKYPRLGAVKTRLVPALGERRACDLYRALVAHTLTETRKFAAGTEVDLEVRVSGAPSLGDAHRWLGDGLEIRDQGEGDLGLRLERATSAAFAAGATAVAVIGGDCPQLASGHLAKAFTALERHDVVLGPASDGGYYLVGLRRPLSALFQGIRWSTSEVLDQTLAAAQAARAEVAQLETLHDLDVAEDLPAWAQTRAASVAGRGGVSVVIPALNEEAWLAAALVPALGDNPHEIIVVDGGSTDRTIEIARGHDVIALSAAPGRARQMNAGAAAATGEFLLFLHADTVVPTGYVELVRATLAGPGVVGGAFGFALSGEFTGRRLVERGTNWRSRVRQMPYGDQGLFVRRDVFAQLGGFPEQPIMEDYEFVRRLRRTGRIALAPAAIVTSGRRWQRLGALRTTVINQLMVAGYLAGISPDRLAGCYQRPNPGSSLPTVAVAPEATKVV